MEPLAARIARKGALQDTDAVGWVIRLARNIERMHALGSVHGHISPRCVLVAGDGCTSRGELLDPRRSPYLVSYHSPERAAGGGTSPADDTWAVAVTLYEALTGSLPFQGATEAEILQQIERAAPPRLAQLQVGDAALQGILDRALARDVAKRIVDVAELRRALDGWRPATRPPRLPALEERVSPRPESGVEDQETEVVTRIRGDISPLLQDMIQLASVSAEPESSRAPRSRPAESTAPPSSKKATPHSTITALASLGLRGATPPPPGVAGPPSSKPRAPASAPRAPAPAAPAAPPGPDAAPASRRSALLDAAARMPSAHDADPDDDDAIQDAPTSVRAPLFRDPSDEPGATRASRPSITDMDTVVRPPVSGLADSGGDSEWDALTLKADPLKRPASASQRPRIVDDGDDPEWSVQTVKADPLERPAAGPQLPGLLDEESHAEPENLFAVPGAWTKLDVPARRPSSAPPTAGAAGGPPPSDGPAAAGPDQPAALAPAKAEAPAPAGRRGLGLLVFVVAAMIGGGATAWFWTRPQPAPDSGAPTASPSAPARAAPAAPSGSPGSSVDRTAVATATAAPAPAAPPGSAAPAAPAAPTASAATAGGVDACLMPLFPANTFTPQARPDFSSLCSERDPRKGAVQLKKQVVLGATNGFVSDGMREWALLGWYEMATFALMRAECCPSPEPLELPATPSPCGPLDKALDDIGAAAAKAKDPADKALEDALKRYSDSIYCMVRAGGTALFGYVGPPKGGEDTAFRKILARAVEKP